MRIRLGSLIPESTLLALLALTGCALDLPDDEARARKARPASTGSRSLGPADASLMARVAAWGPGTGPTASPDVPALEPSPEPPLRGSGGEVLVLLREDLIIEEHAGALSGTRLGALPAPVRREALRRARTELVARLSFADVTLVRAYHNFPVVHVRAPTAKARAALAEDPLVAGLEQIVELRTSDAESLALINQPEVVSEGVTGADHAVVVLDTGVDYTRAAFGACTEPGVPASCRVPVAVDIAQDDGVVDDPANFHGTNVSGIVAATAPGARVIGLDVFDDVSAGSDLLLAGLDWAMTNRDVYGITAVNMSLGGGLLTSQEECTEFFFASAEAFRAAREAGIVPVAASGNEAQASAISFPGCLPSVVSVGAVYKKRYEGFTWPGAQCTDADIEPDQITCFSNSASFLTVLAPGALITDAGLTMGGTSQASPHVAGAIALLRERYPLESSDQLVARLTSTGRPITDPRNGVTTPRIDVAAAVLTCLASVEQPPPLPAVESVLSLEVSSRCSWTAVSSAGWLTISGPAAGSGDGALTLVAAPNATDQDPRVASVTFTFPDTTVVATVVQASDRTAPTGTVVINRGATWTNSSTVTLDIDGTDASGVTRMCVASGTRCTRFEDFALTRTFTLPAGGGTKTVSVWLQDGVGNTTRHAAAPSDTIQLDPFPPMDGAASFVTSEEGRSVSWSGFSDAESGIVSYRVVVASGFVAPGSCGSGEVVYQGSGSSIADVSASRAATYSYRVCAVDTAGNVSRGVPLIGVASEEAEPPSGTVTLNDGLGVTRSRTVTVVIQASDMSRVTRMCVSPSARCDLWVPYRSALSFALTGADGTKTLNVWLEDEWGNVTPAPLSAQIDLDTTPPHDGVFAADPLDAGNALAWSGFIDLHDVASYRIVYAEAPVPPASCADGTVLYEGASASFIHPGLTNGALYAYRLCAIDRAGNMSAGVSVSSVPGP